MGEEEDEYHVYFNEVITVVCHYSDGTTEQDFVFLEDDGRIDISAVEALFGCTVVPSDENGNFHKDAFFALDRDKYAEDKFFTKYSYSPNTTIHVAQPSAVRHADVVCDECEVHPIVGTRYKCKICHDYDLCEHCKTSEKNCGHTDFFVFKRRMWRPYMATGRYLVDTYRHSFANFKQKDCLGYKVNENDNEYKYLNYGEVKDLFTQFGSGLMQFLKERDFVGICAQNCLEWLIADMACSWYSLVAIPVHFALDNETMQNVVNHSGAVCLICSAEYTKKMLSLATANVKWIIQIDKPDESDVAIAKEKGIQLLYFYDVVEKGKAKILPPIRTRHKEISTIYYTSGSTGKPKGVVVNDYCANGELTLNAQNSPRIQMEYLPFGHAMGRDNFKRSCFLGGTFALFTRDMKYIFDEFKIVRPTRIRGVPAVWHTLYEIYLQNLSLARQTHKDIPDEKIEALVKKEIKLMLGDRVETLATGSAATSPAVLEFVKTTFPNVDFYEGYGATEAAGIAANGHLLVSDYKLLDCPELGYFNTDKPNPRGELVVKTKFMSTGYYNDDEANRDGYTEDGYFRTGDIVEVIGRSEVKILDRKKNFFKVAQGEFVRAEFLESTFLASGYIEQIYVAGSPFSKYIVAITVPNMESIKTWALENNIGNYEDRSVLENLIQKEILAIAAKKNLAQYEIPKIVHIEMEPFTVENRLLTPSYKRNRPVLTSKYKDIVSSLLKMKELKEILRKEFGATDVSESDDVFNLVGDSLSKVRFIFQIKEKFAQEIPITYAYDNHTLAELVSYLNGNKGKKLPTEYEEFMADYRNWDKLLPTATTDPPSASEPLSSGNNVFLTGATGFLGGFVLADLLRLTEYDVWCLVRAVDEQLALEKIKHNLVTLGIFAESSFSRVKVVVGDLSKSYLGMSETQFALLCERIDYIVHIGAIVNWQLPYKEQRVSNVLGTQWILEMMKRTKVKPLAFISTYSTHAKFGAPWEIESIALLEKQEGYVLSKWLAEYSVRQHVGKYPISIVRPGMITGHSITGACNHSQFVSRYLRGTFEMGVCIDDKGIMSDINPVDYVSEAIVQLLAQLVASSKESAKEDISKCVHDLADYKHITYTDAWMACRSFNSSIKTLPFLDWRELVVHGDQQNSLYALLPYFPENAKFSTRKPRKLDSDNKAIVVYHSKLHELSIVDALGFQISDMNQ